MEISKASLGFSLFVVEQNIASTLKKIHGNINIARHGYKLDYKTGELINFQLSESVNEFFELNNIRLTSFQYNL